MKKELLIFIITEQFFPVRTEQPSQAGVCNYSQRYNCNIGES